MKDAILAAGKVRFAGEAVAAVVADSRYLAEDALALIDVDYVPLPVTVTAWDTGPGMPVHDEAPDNVLLTRTFTAGDAEAALTAADLIVERELITNRHAGNPMECRAGLALWQPERRRLTFWSSTQVPHIIRNIVAELLGLPESGVRVIAPDVGGEFGVKAGLYPEDVALCRMARALPGTPVKWVEDSGHYAACLDKAVELAGFDEQAHRAEQQRRTAAGEPRLGVGFACYNELTGLGRAASAGPRMPFRTGHDACTVRINPDGTVTAFSGVTSQGQGLETTIAQVVADTVGVGYDDVEVRIGDTDESLWGFGAFSSRQAVIGGGAARLAGEAVRDRALRLAAGILDAKADELTLSGGQIYVNGDERPSLSLAEVGRVAYLESNRLPEGIEPGLEETRFYDPIRGAFAAGAQVARIEIAPDTAELRILDWICVEDAGRIIHPLIVDGQIAGAVAQGIGGALGVAVDRLPITPSALWELMTS